MRVLPICGLVLALAVPTFAQSAQSASSSTPTALPATANDPSVDYSALREKLAQRNKELTDEVTQQRALVKHNQELLKDAQKLDVSNKKLEAEKQRLSAQNADLEKQRDALKASSGTNQASATPSTSAAGATQ